ncbi:hypothetical protein, partial [Aeromonas caviae]|uniref:hypothetical protein n=1 Tax=Aeromonas caviae TaxID=648 RepID=UPI0038D12AAE
RQAIGPLPTGVVEGRGQGVHREDRLSHPGRTDAVNPVLVNRYQLMSLSFLNCDGDCIEINKISITFMVLF